MTPTERERLAIRLAKNTARRMHRPEVHRILLDDLEGAAMLGAAKALAQWDGRPGVAFQTLAIALIRGEVLQFIRDWDYLTRAERAQARRVRAETDEWPEWAMEPLSLDTLREVDRDAFLDHLFDPEANVEAEALALWERAEWRRLVDRLPRSCRIALTEHYFHDQRPAEICRAYGKSKSWVKNIEKFAMPRLREWAEAAGLVP